MSRKHFIAIAATIRTQLDNVQDDESLYSVRATIAETTERLCDAFANENPRFDRVRFMAACGINR